MRYNNCNKQGRTFIIKSIIFILFVLMLSSFLFVFSGCRQYDNKFDISYFFKTDPEKAVLDFIYSMANQDASYVYDNFILDKDKRNVSKEKFLRELSEIMSGIENIEVLRIVYLGYEDEMSKVVVEFEVKYTNGDTSQYKKYIYLLEENSKWKIVFDKTFI